MEDLDAEVLDMELLQIVVDAGCPTDAQLKELEILKEDRHCPANELFWCAGGPAGPPDPPICLLELPPPSISRETCRPSKHVFILLYDVFLKIVVA